MSKPLPAPAPVVRLVPELVEYASERYGERPFLLRHVSGAWTGFSFMAAARAVRAFAALLERRIEGRETRAEPNRLRFC